MFAVIKSKPEKSEDLELLVDEENFSENSYKFNLTLPRKVSSFCLNLGQILEEDNYFALNTWTVRAKLQQNSQCFLPSRNICKVSLPQGHLLPIIWSTSIDWINCLIEEIFLKSPYFCSAFLILLVRAINSSVISYCIRDWPILDNHITDIGRNPSVLICTTTAVLSSRITDLLYFQVL